MDIQRLFELADPRIKKIWDEKETQISKRLEYQRLGFNDFDAEILDTKIENFTGLGYAQLTGEKEAYSYEEVEPGYDVTLTPQKWTKKIDITEEMLRFNLWPKINNGVEGIANALNYRIDLEAAKIFYLGFGTTNFTGGDASALFANSHTMIDGSTQDNYLGTNTLSYDNLKTACQAIDRFYDDKSIQLLPARNLRLVVARENRERALEVLKSIGNPDSANRINNVFSTGEGTIDLVVANYIPASTYGYYWFLIDTERASKMLHSAWGWRAKFDDDKVINNGSKVYTGSVMFKHGFSSWQFAVGQAATA
jgi:hypothetical protein